MRATLLIPAAADIDVDRPWTMLDGAEERIRARLRPRKPVMVIEPASTPVARVIYLVPRGQRREQERAR